MHDVNTIHRFLELRAQEKSLRTIEEQIGVDRRTLAKWEREYKEELKNLKAIEVEAKREACLLTAQARIQRFGEHLQRVMEELETRDFAAVETPKLIDLAIKLDTRLQAIVPDHVIYDETELEERKATHDLITSLSALGKQKQGTHDRGAATNGNGQVNASDLVKLQVKILQRYENNEIDRHKAANELAIVNSIFKGIEIADLQQRLERLETVLETEKAR